MNISFSENGSLKEYEKSFTVELNKAVDFLDKELVKLNANKISPAMVENLVVVANDKKLILKHIATISTQDSSILIINPFDIAMIGFIEKALGNTQLGATPKNDGTSIKMTFPPMSQARRLELIKMVSAKKEESMTILRKVRQDIQTIIKKYEKDKKISEDFSKKIQKSLTTVIDLITSNITKSCEKKEKALLS